MNIPNEKFRHSELFLSGISDSNATELLFNTKDPSRKTRAARDIETQEEDNACLTSPEKPVTYLF